jgi:hypothetical protein
MAEDYLSPAGPVKKRFMLLADGTHAEVVVVAPLSAEDQDKLWFRTVNGAAQRILVSRKVTTAALGSFAANGRVSLTLSGTGAGASGDYLRKLRIEVKTAGKAGVWLHQFSDPVMVQGAAGAAIANAAAQTFTAGANYTFTENALADRVISFLYTPTGGVAQWFTTRIASHAALTATSAIAVTLEDTPPAGSAPTQWMIEGLRSRRVLDPASAAGVYEVEYNELSEYGGWMLSVGAGVISAEAFGGFSTN